MHSVDGGMLGQEQLQLCKQGEVVRRDVGVRAAADVVLQEPVVVQRSQDTQNVQLRLRAEDVIDHTLQREERREEGERNKQRGSIPIRAPVNNLNAGPR